MHSLSDPSVGQKRSSTTGKSGHPRRAKAGKINVQVVRQTCSDLSISASTPAGGAAEHDPVGQGAGGDADHDSLLREPDYVAKQKLPMTTDEIDWLDRFLGTFFWEVPQNFVKGAGDRKVSHHGCTAITLRSEANVVHLMRQLLSVRQDCLRGLYPGVVEDELENTELEEADTTACYTYFFQQWVDDPSHWRDEQFLLYPNRSLKWKPFNAHVQRVYGGKKFVIAIFQHGLSWMPCAAGGQTPAGAMTAFIRFIRLILDAKAEHDEDPATAQARMDSGKRGHTYKDTCRGQLRQERTAALLRLLHARRLRKAMEAAELHDSTHGLHWKTHWDSEALDTWHSWSHHQRSLYRKLEAGVLEHAYASFKKTYNELFHTAVAKRFRLGQPR